MTTENKLINKSYYETIIDEKYGEHPIKMLGELYMEEMKKEQPELSFIRYAQGEVYFLHQDYEAAIYKWQHPLDNTFVPWAQKNIADAHMKLGLWEYAEKYYKEVETESVTLKTEVLLNLFSLYKHRGHEDKAIHTIKNAITLNPDYANVTGTAKQYFEEIEDWKNAIELAVNEAIRTESHFWFDVIEEYVGLGHTSNHEPNYFNKVLETLYYLDTYRFEGLTGVLWNSYQQSELYLDWLEELNKLLVNLEIDEAYIWKKLPILFEEAYFFLISGQFFIKDISNLLEVHLTNWLKLTPDSESQISSTAILAWHERFPSELAATVIQEAEHVYMNSTSKQNGRQEGLELLDAIKLWAEKEDMSEGLTEFMKPTIQEYNMDVATPSKLRSVIKDALAYLTEQKIELENDVLQEISWNGEILTKLHGFQQQIIDMEEEKSTLMEKSFHDIKATLIKDVREQLPKLLRGCSDLVKEDSDFSKINRILNEEMNRRIAEYMENTVLPAFKQDSQEWITTCEKEFQESETIYRELSESMNQQFNEEKLVLSGDFHVLHDWKRDIERIARGLLRLEKVNIFMKNNPSQLLLKSAGKLLGSLPKNKEMLRNRYKNYIETTDYSEVAGETIQVFIQQLELFEESIEWDVRRFFSDPQKELIRIIEEVEAEIEKHNASLETMREKPEIYQDPLTLFEVQLRQYELMYTEN